MKLVTYAAAAAAVIAAGSASASTTIYNNGPANGSINAYKIFFSTSLSTDYQIADTFTAGSNNIATGMTFSSWESFSNNAVTSVDWAIYDGNPFSGGTELGFGTATSGGGTLTSNFSGFTTGVYAGLYSVYSNTISFGSNVNVSNNCGGGGCWILLAHAQDALSDGTVYWDLNNGPSTAWSNVVGDLKGNVVLGTNSETFSILGTVPEPAAWALMLVGLAGLGAALRAKRKAPLSA